jgi:hypothetical protein
MPKRTWRAASLLDAKMHLAGGIACKLFGLSGLGRFSHH